MTRDGDLVELNNSLLLPAKRDSALATITRRTFELTVQDELDTIPFAMALQLTPRGNIAHSSWLCLVISLIEPFQHIPSLFIGRKSCLPVDEKSIRKGVP